MERARPIEKKPLMFIVVFLILTTVALLLASAGLTPALAAPDTQTMVPHSSWDCGMPQGIPEPTGGTLVFEADLTLGQVYDMGQTQYGHRHLIEVKGGTISGSRINGRVMTGGLDYQLTLSNGTQEIEQILVFRTSSGSYIYVRVAGTATSDSEVRIVPDFEAPNLSAFAFLNTGKFAGIREFDEARKTMKLTVYDVSGITIQPNAANAIRVTEPTDMPDQPYECRAASPMERQGTQLYREVVRIGTSQSVGASKNGNRNIIPITGGTATGDIAGRVLAGGADYQILGPLTLDARYTIQTNDGELIIVRNCGPAGNLVPTFETRAAGRYGYLNDQLWLSSSPMPGLGTVTLTIYESRGSSSSSSSGGCGGTTSSSSGGCN